MITLTDVLELKTEVLEDELELLELLEDDETEDELDELLLLDDELELLDDELLLEAAMAAPELFARMSYR